MGVVVKIFSCIRTLGGASFSKGKEE